MEDFAGLSSIIMLVNIVIVVITSVTLLMQNRPPVKTMAWLLVLLLIPVLGFIIYLFFGRDIRKEKYINQHGLDQLERRSLYHFVEQKNLVIPKQHAELIRQFANQNMALPFNDNDVDVYTSGHDLFLTLIQEIGKARQHIHINTYIFEDDALGRLVADLLIDKAQQGVIVRVIYDDVGCWRVDDKLFRRMSEAGIEVYPFMPVRFPAFTSKVNYRNHRKICVVDGVTGFIGGMNIAVRYVKGKGSQPWRDTHLRLCGRGVYGLQTAFLADWYFVSQVLVAGPNYYPAIDRGKDALAQIVTSDPTSEWPEIMQGYVRILLEAKRYVYLETPYFLPTEPVIFALRTCALAGVDVRIVIPEKSDTMVTGWAGRSFFEEVMEAGVKIYLFRNGFNHSKLLVCDDNLCSCGSTNVDFRSFENNFEANAFIYDKDVALKIRQVVEEDIAQSILLDSERFHHRGFMERLWESLLRLFSPLL